MSEIKVGDRVRYAGNSVLGTVIDICEGGASVRFDVGGDWWLRAEHLQVIPTPSEFGVGDRSIDDGHPTGRCADLRNRVERDPVVGSIG